MHKRMYVNTINIATNNAFVHSRQKMGMLSVGTQTIVDNTLPEKQKPEAVKQPLWYNVKNAFDTYNTSASIHGVSRLGDPQCHFIRRFTWFVLVLAMAVSLGVTVQKQISRLHSYPIRTVSKASSHTSLPFPTVTICSLNQYYVDRMPDDPMLRAVFFYKSEYAHLFKSQNAFMRNLSSLQNSPITGEDLLRVAHYAAPRLNELLRVCVWNVQLHKCEDIFERANTSYGPCYRLKAMKEMVHWAGPTQGLKLYLNINHSRSYFSHMMEAGIKVVVHEQEETAFPNMYGWAVQPGVSAVIALSRQETTRLPYPYKAFGNGYCEDSTADDYVNKLSFKTYTQTHCISDCFLNFTQNMCGCRGYNQVDPLDTVPVCNASQYFSCYMSVQDRITEQDINACSCAETCKTTSYRGEIHFADFASSFIEEQALTDGVINDPEEFKRSVIQLTIFYKTLSVESLEQLPEISEGEILANLGGQMGLFLGASVLSFAELFELLILLIYRFFRTICLRILGPKTNKHTVEPTDDGKEYLGTESGDVAPRNG